MGNLALIITAIATAVIAYYAVVSHRLTLKIRSRDKEFRQAVILSGLMSAPGTIDVNTLRRRIEVFKEGRPDIEELFRINEGG